MLKKTFLFSFVSLLIISISPSFARIYEYNDQTPPHNSYSKVINHYYNPDYHQARLNWLNNFIQYTVLREVGDNYQKSSILFPKEAADIIPGILIRRFKTINIPEGYFEARLLTPQEAIERSIANLIETEKAKVETLAAPADFFLDQEKREMFEIAKAVKNILSPDDTLIVLGQSPAYLAQILEKTFRVHLIHIPMSGIPDFIEAVRGNAQDPTGNLLTPEKQNFYRELLKERGYDPSTLTATHKTFILDLKNTGRGTAAFVRQIIQWNKDLGLTELPDLNIISLIRAREPFSSSQSLTSHQELFGIFNHPQPYEMDIKFAEFKFTIDEYAIPISSQLHLKFDTVPGSARLVPNFQARFWVPESRDLIVLYPRPYAQAIVDDLLNSVDRFESKKEESQTND